jgi:hypothetical protein
VRSGTERRDLSFYQGLSTKRKSSIKGLESTGNDCCMAYAQMFLVQKINEVRYFLIQPVVFAFIERDKVVLMIEKVLFAWPKRVFGEHPIEKIPEIPARRPMQSSQLRVLKKQISYIA